MVMIQIGFFREPPFARIDHNWWEAQYADQQQLHTKRFLAGDTDVTRVANTIGLGFLGSRGPT